MTILSKEKEWNIMEIKLSEAHFENKIEMTATFYFPHSKGESKEVEHKSHRVIVDSDKPYKLSHLFISMGHWIAYELETEKCKVCNKSFYYLFDHSDCSSKKVK